MKVKTWTHTSLAVNDLQTSIDFYGAAFGFKVAFREVGMTGEIRAMMGRGGLSCDLALLKSPHSAQMLELIAFEGGVPEGLDRPLPAGAAHIAFTVEDLDEAIGEVERLGARRIGAVATFPEGRAVYCRAPGGSFFELEDLADDDWAG